MKPLTLILLLLLLSCTDYQDAFLAANKTEAQTLQLWYGSEPEQNIIVDLPANRSTDKTPVIICMYGSAWQGGGIPQSMYRTRELLKQHLPEAAVVLLNHRPGTLDNPARITQLQDLAAACQFLKDHRKELEIKPHFAFFGTSSGGHIMSVFAAIINSANSAGAENPIKAQAYIVPPVKFPESITPAQAYMIQFLLGIPAGQITPDILKKYRYLEPYHLAHKRLPALFIAAGTNDPVVPISGVLAYKNRLDSLQVENTIKSYPFGHGTDVTASQNSEMMQHIGVLFSEKLNITLIP